MWKRSRVVVAVGESKGLMGTVRREAGAVEAPMGNEDPGRVSLQAEYD